MKKVKLRKQLREYSDLTKKTVIAMSEAYGKARSEAIKQGIANAKNKKIENRL